MCDPCSSQQRQFDPAVPQVKLEPAKTSKQTVFCICVKQMPSVKQIPSETRMQVYTQETTVKKCCTDLEDMEIKEIGGFGLIYRIFPPSEAL